MASGLHRSLCIRPQVFHACLKLLKMLLTQYIPKHKLGKLETAHCVERTLPSLLARTGDSSSRLRVAACNFIQVRAPSCSSAVLRPVALSSQKRCSERSWSFTAPGVQHMLLGKRPGNVWRESAGVQGACVSPGRGWETEHSLDRNSLVRMNLFSELASEFI